MKIQGAWVPVILVAAIACEEAAQQDPMGIDVAFSSAVVGKVIGHGSTGFDPANLNASNLDFTIAAILHEDGSVKGHVTILGDGRGLVREEVPPHGAIDFWCINVQEVTTGNPDLRFNLYVSDVGDGKTSFDEISIDFGQGLTCAGLPTPTLPLIPLIQGNFRTTS